MGLQPVQHWFPRGSTAADIARKRRALRDRPEAVVGCLPRGKTAAARCARAVGGFFNHDCHELSEAALLVPDDLCVMRRAARTYELVAAAVFSPSYWNLNEKLGLDLADIHASHQGLNERIGDRMQRFFERLPSGRVFERRNWFLHHDDEPFHASAEVTPPPPVHELVIRSERQTLRRIDADVILFTIDVTFAPLSGLIRYPAEARSMVEAIRSWSEEERYAFGLERFEDELLNYLENLSCGSRLAE